MTVAEFIAVLKTMPQDAEVVVAHPEYYGEAYDIKVTGAVVTNLKGNVEIV